MVIRNRRALVTLIAALALLGVVVWKSTDQQSVNCPPSSEPASHPECLLTTPTAAAPPIDDQVPTSVSATPSLPALTSTGVSMNSSRTPVTPSSPLKSPTTPSDTYTGTYRMGMRPFAAASSWNTPVGPAAKFTPLSWPTTGVYWANWEEYTPSIHLTRKTDPVVSVTVPSNWGRPAGTVKLRIPANVTGASGTDGELLIIDNDVAYNFWQFKRTSRTSGTAVAYGLTHVRTGSGWGKPRNNAGIMAVGASELAGLLTESDLKAGEIRHALQLVVAQNLQKPGFVPPALNGDGKNPNGILQEGQRVAIPPTTALPGGLSPLGTMVAKVLVTYGAYDVDTDGPNTTLIRTQSNAFDPATISALREDLKKLIPLLQIVS